MIALLAYLVLSNVNALTCHWNVDIMILQDTSESYSDSMDYMRSVVAGLVEASRGTFARARFAVSSFIDKPLPFRGFGNGRGHPEALDYCYKRESNLLTEPSDIVNAHGQLANGLGSGGDGPENVYEAMAYAATDLGIYNRFTLSTERPLVRFVIAATDDLPHYHGDVQKGIDLWNGNQTHKPRFLDSDFIDYDFGLDVPTLFGGSAQYGESYSKLVEIKDQTSSPEYAKLIKLLGPRTFTIPDPWSPLSDPSFTHTGTSQDSHCSTTEYPTLAELKSVLSKQNVFPVILLSQPSFVTRESATICQEHGFNVQPSVKTKNAEFMKCLISIYETDLALISSAYLVRELTNSTQADIQELVRDLTTIGTDLECEAIPGIGPWIAGAVAGATAVGCIVPCATKKPELPAGQFEAEDRPDMQETDSTYEIGEDTCSWDNYV